MILNETEKKLLFYALASIQYKLFYDEEFKKIDCANTPAHFDGMYEFKEITSDKQLQETIENVLDKLCK